MYYNFLINKKKGQDVKDEINPERAKHIRATKAEETLLSSLMLNPDFYKKIKEAL